MSSPSTISGTPSSEWMPFSRRIGFVDVRVVDIGDENGDALGGDPTGEPLAEWNPHALLDLLLDAAGGAGDELIGRGVVEQDRHRVDAERDADPLEQLLEQCVEAELG